MHGHGPDVFSHQCALLLFLLCVAFIFLLGLTGFSTPAGWEQLTQAGEVLLGKSGRPL